MDNHVSLGNGWTCLHHFVFDVLACLGLCLAFSVVCHSTISEAYAFLEWIGLGLVVVDDDDDGLVFRF
jgi:hypothetical protein